MALLDLLGRRWALRVIWELRDGALGFRELQARAGGLSPTILSTRLEELRGAGLVEDAGGGVGRALGAARLSAAVPRRTRVDRSVQVGHPETPVAPRGTTAA